MSSIAQAMPRLPPILDYAERPEVHDRDFDRWGREAAGLIMARGTRLRARGLYRILPHVRRAEAGLAEASDEALRERARDLRITLRLALAQGRPTAQAVGPSFALIREAAGRTLGMRHHDVQLLGAWAMMQGMVAEMGTGEGKTLCATLAAATAALGGEAVHVITVNDYLAERDAELMGPVYRFLGLSVGVIKAGQQADERRAIYACDIVHGFNKEIAFDYLRDRMELRSRPGNLRRKLERLGRGEPMPDLRMRGLHFAIVDEADSVLIDDARTPLIISGQVTQAQGHDPALFETAASAAAGLEEGRDYRVQHNEHRIEITEDGKDRLDDLAEDDESSFRIAVIREQAVVQALTAMHLFHRDEDYIIRDGKVQIVDENTGRIMEDRTWSEGLHQMIELKEGVELTAPRETLSRITYQRFFRRYRRMAGMTGTARDAAWEMWAVYGLAVVQIPLNRPDARRFARDHVYATEAQKWRAIGQRICELHAEGAPVLLGTRSVASSDKGSAELTALGIPHEVLSATQDGDEAAVVARAGQRGAVTVATNMAGRGTDIKLGPGVADLGGLHVILSERHDSRRVDRQLEGRCGRQGDPGRVEAFLSLEDELMRSRSARIYRRLAGVAGRLGPSAAGLFIRARQRQIESSHARMRRDLLESDRKLGTLLAFSGQLE